MKKLFILVVLIAFASCGSSKDTAVSKNENDNTDYALKYASTITAKDLGNHLFTYASDEFEGRNTGESGQKKAINYLKGFYVNQGISSPIGGDDYFQEVPASYMNKFSRRGNFSVDG